MLFEGFLHVAVPILPRMPARMFKIGMRNTTGFEKGMKAAIVIEQMIFNAAVKRQDRHVLWVKLIDDGVTIQVMWVARPIPMLRECICTRKST